MRKWEYCTLLCLVGGCYVDGEPSKTAGFKETLNRLGEEGWELVGVSPGEDMEFYFKREKT